MRTIESMKYAQRGQRCWGRLLVGDGVGDGEEEKSFLVEAIICPFPRASLTESHPTSCGGRRQRCGAQLTTGLTFNLEQDGD